MREYPHVALSSNESELRFQALFDSAAEFIFVIDPDGCILLTNRYVSTQSGYSPQELAGRDIREFFTDSSKKACDCNFPELRSSGHNRAEVEFVCRDGGILQMECIATAIPDEHGKFTSFLIIQRDITERKRAAAELADSERRFRAIFNSTFQFIGLLSPDGILLEANKAALESVAASDRDVVGKHFWDTPWWSGQKEAQQRLKTAIRKASRGEMVRYETQFTDKDGKIIHIDFSLKPVNNERGETVLIIPEGRDITERRMAEEAACQHQQELAHLMRLSIMGEIAASMAHELNQPLTALISYCGTALSRLNAMPSLPDGVLDILAHANQQAHRASEIIQHIRNFISKKNSSRRPVDVDRTILELSRFLDRELHTSHVDLSLDLGGRGHLVMADSVQIEQVLINLIRNSIEAIHNAGIIDGRLLLQTRLPDAAALEVTVSDNGPGIEPAMCNCLFEPFQTSKETGMGMGLSISRSIIQAHEGKIWLEKTGAQGTTFCIRLPLLESES